MKKLVLIVFASISVFSYSQKIDINFIITVDGNVNPNISNLKFKIVTINNDTIVYDIDYAPGSLKVDKKFFDDIKNVNYKNISLVFINSDICKDGINYYFYEINDFKKSWLESYYFILYIYDTNKRKYKKVFTPLLNKEFTYEYDSPEGSMRRVTKKKRKDF